MLKVSDDRNKHLTSSSYWSSACNSSQNICAKVKNDTSDIGVLFFEVAFGVLFFEVTATISSKCAKIVPLMVHGAFKGTPFRP